MAHLILRAWQELDKRSDAIRRCGAEILKLRRQVEMYHMDRDRLESQLKGLHRNAAEDEMVRVGVVDGPPMFHFGGRDVSINLRVSLFLSTDATMVSNRSSVSSTVQKYSRSVIAIVVIS